MSTTTSPAHLRYARQLTGRDMWFGPSGALVTGEQIATHAEAAATLMAREGWDPQLYERYSGRHLRDALLSTELDGQGDADTRFIAGKLMEMLLQLHTGAPYVFHEAWAAHSSRTLAEVLLLLHCTADLARKTGPTAAPGARPQLP